jgi:hypothetical protein
MVSAVAFLAENERQIDSVRNRAAVDLLMCLNFFDGGDSCNLRLVPLTDLGAEVAAAIHVLSHQANKILVIVDPLQ